MPQRQRTGSSGRFGGGGGDPAAAAVSATRLPRMASTGHARTWLVQAKTAVHRTPILIAPVEQFRRASDVACMDEPERRLFAQGFPPFRRDPARPRFAAMTTIDSVATLAEGLSGEVLTPG